ncbi:hypothetical protein BDW02DRAFT_314930 [Decorospora gaudefroyi]|uniref:Zn(2)-C6 fungal-type domain-containing protein n=1 Tax=Decorospora gaudefroyi TaxID=184978 RepID=A0A6A5KGP9_9PLEO|nr:hypothetical protein BDW02DRAFT_314930 [Decorospora gaudefroyi]
MPSKSRGLRTSTGCWTCRKRRVKCDEIRPSCKNCQRVHRECIYVEKPAAPHRPQALSARNPGHSSAATESLSSNCITEPTSDSRPMDGPSSEPVAAVDSWIPFLTGQSELPENGITGDGFFLDDNLFTFEDNLTSSFGPVEWYDLLAEDAISSMQEQPKSNRWNFDITSLSRKQSPRQELFPEPLDDLVSHVDAQAVSISAQLWNSVTKIDLKQDELVFFDYYIDVVAPILDLFDPAKHFANVVPHIALHNVGLLKSLLAVGACHMALERDQNYTNEATRQSQADTPALTSSASSSTQKIAEQFYYETLHYLSQNLLYQSYTSSIEILATGIMISTYEMFATAGTSDHSNWDRHLRGAFWIQRNTETNGESVNGLQRAIWWAWLRQDVWAAFRTGRPALTIHQPKVPMAELTSEELATRIIYIAAKCVQFAATPKQGDIVAYIEAGETLLRMLDAWKRTLPPSFEPIPIASVSQGEPPTSALADDRMVAIWIHPPAHAAAVQTYHFARIVMILNQPSTGGLNTYQTRFKLLRESTATICGIAIAQQSQNLPSAFVSFQAVYAAALCAETKDRQSEVLEILGTVLSISKFPSISILDELADVWSGEN